MTKYCANDTCDAEAIYGVVREDNTLLLLCGQCKTAYEWGQASPNREIVDLFDYIPEVDQYGNPLPEDLVPIPGCLTSVHWNWECLRPHEIAEVERQIETILNLAWYESADDWVLVSSAELEKAIPDWVDCIEEPDDLGIDMSEIRYIAQPLHRHNMTDGFYHA